MGPREEARKSERDEGGRQVEAGHNDPRLNHGRVLRSRQQQWRGRRDQREQDLADAMRHHFGSPVSGSAHDAADDPHMMPAFEL